MIKKENYLLKQFWILAPLLLLSVAACKGKKEYKNPPGYDLHKPSIVHLPSALDEVSGIFYYPKDNSVFLESDEQGSLYKLNLAKPKQVQEWKFGKKHDYEDLFLLDSAFYMLCSNGDLTILNFNNDNKIAKRQYTFPYGDKYEFESLYFDDHTQKLNLVCKTCKGEDKENVAVYSFDPKTYMYGQGFSINATAIHSVITDNAGKLKASAANINPVTGELFLISSVNKLLIIADKSGRVKSAYQLDPSLFKQPEGLCFRSNGDMFITNESGGAGTGNILFFPYKNKQVTK